MASEVRFNRNGLILGTIGVLVLLFIIYRSSRSDTVRISELLSASIVVAERGGKRIVEIREMDDHEIGKLSKGRTKEGRDEYVTLGDKSSHEIIVSGLLDRWPNLPLQSEENDIPLIKVDPLPTELDPEISEIVQAGDLDIPIDDIAVWVDPLDATQEYTEGGENPDLLKFVTVMVCIAVKGKPIAGVIHQPYEFNQITKTLGVTKWGWVEHGISESLVASTEDHLGVEKHSEIIRVISSRSHSGDVREVAEKAFPDKVHPIVAAGAGYKVLQVIENRADLYLHTTAIKKWDICAGNALLDAGGGRMTTRRGEAINYDLEGNVKNEDGLVVALDKFESYLERVRIN